MGRGLLVRPSKVKPYQLNDFYISRMLLDDKNSEAKSTHINHGILKKGGKLEYGSHPGYDETYVILKGKCMLKIDGELMDIQEGDKVYQQMKKVTRVAITEFTYGDEFNSFTRNVQDILYTNLIQRGMTVIEREKMEQVMEELAKSFSGMIDSATAAEIGKMLGWKPLS